MRLLPTGRIATPPAPARYTRDQRNPRTEPSHAHVPRTPQGAGPHHPPLRPVLRDDPRRPRRRRGQGRAPGRRGRHAPDPAVHGRRERAVHALQPEQAFGGARPEIGRRPRDLQGDGGGHGYRGRKLQAGHCGPARDRLRRPVRPQPPAGLLLDLRVRPYRPVRAARRFRPHCCGHVRIDEHQRSRRRASVPHSHPDHRPRGWPQRGHRHPQPRWPPASGPGAASASIRPCSSPGFRWASTKQPGSSRPARFPNGSGRGTAAAPRTSSSPPPTDT